MVNGLQKFACLVNRNVRCCSFLFLIALSHLGLSANSYTTCGPFIKRPSISSSGDAFMFHTCIFKNRIVKDSTFRLCRRSSVACNKRHSSQSFKRAMMTSSSFSGDDPSRDSDYYSLDNLHTRMQAFVLKQQQEIESSRIQLAVALAGGGSHFLSTLTSTPGASTVLLEGTVTYDRASYWDYVESNSDNDESIIDGGDETFRYASLKASRLLGAATMRRAVYLTAKGDKLHVPSIVQVSTAPQASSQDITTRMGQAMGIAMTSKLQSTSKWPSRAYVVVERQNGPSLTIEATLSSTTARTRLEEDVFVSHMLLTCLEKALDDDADTLNGNVVKASGNNHERIVTTDCGDVLAISVPPKIDPQQAVADAIHRILSQGESCVMLIPDYSTSRVIGSNGNTLHWKPLAAPSLPPKSLVVSGSFNPPHVGHIGLARAALDATTCPTVWFELALTNADKVNDWTVDQVLNRLNGFATLLPDPQTNPFSWGVILTNNAPLFVDKAYLLDPLQAKSKLKRLAGQEQLHFVIGTDTLVRMVDPKYYDNSRDEMLDTLAKMPCRFVVGGRLQQNKDANDGQLEVFVTGQEQVDELPNELQDKFVLLPHFRMDISSTELRKRMAADR